MIEFRSIVVLEKTPPKFNTGILDMFGNMIIRTEFKQPIGFVWFDEKAEIQDKRS